MMQVMVEISSMLEEMDYILRSGGADGADKAFSAGVIYNTNEEVFLPWKGFNGSNSQLYVISREATQLAQKYHPYWNNLSQGAQKLHARNVYQILGYDLNTPSDFVLCYTENGKLKGGTAQALRIAMDNDIPVFNFGNYDDVDLAKAECLKFIEENKR